MFRANQIIQDKAQYDNNGLVLVEDCNAGLDYLVCSLRANREAPIYSVAPFGKDLPFPARSALCMTASRFAEHVYSTLEEY